MKKNILFFAILFASISSFAQTQLNLKINHKLGSNAFAFNDTCYNNLGNKINLSRLEYYLTIVSVTHDGGTVTPIDKVLLINPNVATLDSLTTINITTLEKVTIAVGVKSTLNHLDPSLYSSSHPLAPKSPSMHWGWTPGYRFVAMEGRSFSITPSRIYEIHSLGDQNYFHTTITTAGVSSTGKKTIELNADYLEALRGIDVSRGPLDHGDYGNNITHLNNFRDYVFTSVEGNPSLGINKINMEQINLSVSPNPSLVGNEIVIKLSEELKEAILLVTDLKGCIVYQQKIISKQIILRELKKGSYICTVKKDGATLTSSKLIITN